jgi:DNA-binding NarL/FixJ family response regulator
MSRKVLLADDHQISNEGLRVLLERGGKFEVVGMVNSGREVERMVRRLGPDLVIMDIGMPELNGIEAARKLRRLHPKVTIIALTMHDDRRYVSAMMGAGVRAYILKENAVEELELAIKTVAAGEIYISKALRDKYQDQLPEILSGSAQSLPEILTAREREVLQLLAEGKKTIQIGELLHVSAKTIETHRSNIMKKLRLNTLADLTRYAIREGLVSVDG